jgi:hypothetical protein
MLDASVALDLAVGADFGALREVLGMLILRANRLPELGNNRDGKHGRHETKVTQHH